jgi:hypothetical protein
LLAIILPTSLLITLKLTGIIPEPQQPETMHVHSVDWNMTRPSDYIAIDKWVENSYNDGKASVGLGVNIEDYAENWVGPPAYGNDFAQLRITSTAEMEDGFIYSFSVKFLALDTYGFVGINSDPSSYELSNLQMSRMCGLLASESKAYFEASAINFPIDKPKNCSLSMLAYWIFVEGDNIDHLITISLEVTYYDGTTYKKVEIPINLGVLKD